MNKAELFRRIQELAFVKCELELFLDTHPDCRASLDYYHRTVDEYDALVEEYEAKYGPLTAAANVGEKWNWVTGPWPWHLEANGGVGPDKIDGTAIGAMMNGRK